MVTSESLAVTGVLVLVGLLVAGQARTPYSRYRTIRELTSATQERTEPGTETVVRGLVSVTEPAIPDRTPPESLSGATDSPAIWAWRVRHKEGGGSSDVSNAYWTTTDGGLSVGEFTVSHDWDHVRVDDDWLRSELETAPDDVDDPFDASTLFLGTPESDVPLGELGPLNRLLERLGMTGDDGAFTNWEMSINVGSRTTSPDRYQATVIEDGDELVVRGKLAETADGLVLRGTDETPLVIATGDLEREGKRLRSRAIWQGVFALVLFVLAGAVVAVELL